MAVMHFWTLTLQKIRSQGFFEQKNDNNSTKKFPTIKITKACTIEFAKIILCRILTA